LKKIIQFNVTINVNVVSVFDINTCPTRDTPNPKTVSLKITTIIYYFTFFFGVVSECMFRCLRLSSFPFLSSTAFSFSAFNFKEKKREKKIIIINLITIFSPLYIRRSKNFLYLIFFFSFFKLNNQGSDYELRFFQFRYEHF
jgi:hypothetical protein